MASFGAGRNEVSPNHIEIGVHDANSMEPKPSQGSEVNNDTDYFQRAQWLRAAVLGANDGLVSVASLMMGIGAVKEDITALLLAGFASLVAGACSMAIGEFISVYTQYDIEMAQTESGREVNRDGSDEEAQEEKLPNPFHAALASALAFSVGAVLPLLAAVFIRNYKISMIVVAVVSSLALFLFGVLGALLGKVPIGRSSARVIIGGWMAMAITFGLTKLFGSTGL